MRNLIRVKIVSADIGQLLGLLNQKGISIYEIEQIDSLTVCFSVALCDLDDLRILVQKRGETIQIIKKTGPVWVAKAILARPLLMIGLVILLLIMCFLPGRVLFIQVEGNQRISDQTILSAAEACGISFGVSRRGVRSERMKNALLQMIPELQWAGINTRGVVAVISVRERENEESPGERVMGQVSHIVAAQDGIITGCTAENGMLLCKVGQAVRKGEVLISAYTDCGLKIQATQAQGEVYANTFRTERAVLPAAYIKRYENITQKKNFSLILGKKQINLLKDSGIYDTSCVKMYSEYYMTLPGGFVLPITLVVETFVTYACNTQQIRENTAELLLQNLSRQYVREHMVAGEIIRKQEEVSFLSGNYCLLGQYACHEMIGRTKIEENGYTDGKSG